MILHAFTEYLKYSWTAKGRHGTHSPFVYRFVEEVLMDKGGLDKTYLVSCPSLALKYENLIARIAAYYKYRDVLVLPREHNMAMPPGLDMLLLKDSKPKEWISEMDRHYTLLKSSGAVIVMGVHNSALHTKCWQQLCGDKRVKMSIDMYGIGMLLFREEFKERQHFVLKY